MRHALRSTPASHLFHRSPLVLAAALACTGWAHAQSDQAVTSDTALPPVTVRAKTEAPVSQHLDRPVAAGALGTRTALETPYATATVTAEQIQQGTPRKLGDLFLNDASVSDNSGSNTAWATYLSVRGLPLDWQDSFRIDGKPFLSYAVTLPYEMFEQIDLLKGSSGFMYGFGAPGGMLNYVTKKPTDTPVRSVSLGYSSDSLWRTNADLGGRMGEDQRFGYRLSATHEEGTTSNDGQLRRDSVLLALDARLTSALTWDFQSLYQDRRASNTEISIASYSLAGTRLPRALRNDDATLVGPGNHTDNSFQFYSTGLTYQLNQDWQLSGSYSHSATRTRRNESVLTLLDAEGNYTDTRSDYAEVYQFNNLEARVQGHLRTGGL
ncbi:MAG TPA: TonB-dependent receptor plug domain-containing protein, partial [Candidatus Aquabacterium excrementipullorum]|nr:TonB-dependent receptor plug domain-containing protein [Candidatus Aquabacterium excrementipullorum]